MTTWANADLLVEILDRQLKFLVGQKDERRLMALSQWLSFLGREPQLAALLREMVGETRVVLDKLSVQDAAVRKQLLALWKTHGDTIRSLLDAHSSVDDLDDFCSLDDFEKLALQRPRFRIPDREIFDDTSNETAQLTKALHQWATWAIGRGKKREVSVPNQVHELRDRAKEAELLVQHRQRLFRTTAETMAGAAFVRLRTVSKHANPRPPRYDAKGESDMRGSQLSLFTFFEMSQENEFAGKVHGRDALSKRMLDPDEVSAAAEQLARDARLVTHELQVRILAGRSRLSLVQRYAAKCEGFDSARLRELLVDNSRNAERTLTLDFAKYLFDQGLTPLLDPTIGGLRPDVVTSTPGPLLYVEAKQYGEHGARQTILDAYKQVWSTWGRLRNQYRVPEAFLLVFRVGGPRVELPSVVEHKGLRLWSVLADISEEGGSKEKRPPISFDQADLVPQDAADDDSPTEGPQ